MILFLSFPTLLLVFTVIKQPARFQGKAPFEWIEQVKMPANGAESDPGLIALKNLGPSAIPILRRGMQSVKTSHRFKSAWALGQIGAAASNAIPELVKALDDEDLNVRINATQALTAIGMPNDALIPKLIPRLTDANLAMSGCSGDLLRVLVKHDRHSAYAEAFLRASSPWARLMILPRLKDATKDDEKKPFVFQTLLNDSNGWVREETVKFLKSHHLAETNLIPTTRAANLITTSFP